MNNPIIDALTAQADDGFSAVSSATLEELSKALTAGYATDATSMTGGRALIPQSLDATLVSVTHAQDDAKLFKKLKRSPVASTVHEYNKRTSYGAQGGAFVSEGGDSIEKDVTLQRRVVFMKYLQTLRKVTLQMTAAKTLEDAQAFEAQNGTMWLIQQVEQALFTGNSAIIAEEFDGLDVGITAANTIDARGRMFSDATEGKELEQMFTEAGRRIRAKFGKVTDAFLSLSVMADIQALYRDRVRVPAADGNSGNANGAGYTIDRIYTPFGTALLNDDVFIQEGDVPAPSGVAGAPSAPTITATRAAATHGTSQFETGDAGNYYYKVAAINKYGQGAVSAASAVNAVVAGDEVTIAITDGATVGTGYIIFRTKKGGAVGSEYRECFRVARTGATTTVYDLNAYLAGCSTIYIGNLDPMADAIEWSQFLPMMKFPLYPTNAAVYPFLLLLFGSLNLKKEEHWVKIINVQPSSLAWY